MKSNPVVHFEIPGEDMERMKKFYQETFGWEMNQMGPEMGNYVVVMTSESDNNGPLEKGRINGGFFKRTPDNTGPSVVIAVENIREAMRKVEKAGGKLIGMEKPGEPMDIPGVGLYMPFVDTEGNRMSILEPSAQM